MRDDALEGFLSSPQDNPAKWLAMLYAYLDESGHEQKNDWMCVAGFVGTEGQWKKAAPLWLEAIINSRII